MKNKIQMLVLFFLLISFSVFCEKPINTNNVSDSLSRKTDNIGILELGVGIEDRDMEKSK